ncbi:MAG TPA: alkaline phosphatase family protein [Blastocatellia bacterium]|nr:alkaline phosphatase family protein [Blastocatellia bacterium]
MQTPIMKHAMKYAVTFGRLRFGTGAKCRARSVFVLAIAGLLGAPILMPALEAPAKAARALRAGGAGDGQTTQQGPTTQGNQTEETPIVEESATKAFYSKVQHIVVIYQENWSFDSLYPDFPGANGIANAAPTTPQIDKSGNPITVLPQPLNNGAADMRFPANLPVAPYDMTKYVPADQITGDIIHRYYHEQLQIDNGKMDKFVTWSDNGGLVFSYINAKDLAEGKLAQQYVMCDNFFHSAFGGSFLNHQFLIAAQAPTWPNAPASLISNPDASNLNDNVVTPDGFAVNTSFTINSPHPASSTDPTKLVPEQTNPTIGDRLTAAGVSWKWYSGGWDNALAGQPDPLFQFHHQPFAYYQNYKDGTQAKADHLQDETKFFTDITGRTLPAVSFIKPLGPDNEHPGYANEVQGQNHVAALVNAIMTSKYRKNTVIIITYDENGGRWDHVAPPVVDPKWGPGTRVPAIIISKFAKNGFVDHTQYETVSILKFIEAKYGLQPLTARDAGAKNLLTAFKGF